MGARYRPHGKRSAAMITASLSVQRSDCFLHWSWFISSCVITGGPIRLVGQFSVGVADGVYPPPPAQHLVLLDWLFFLLLNEAKKSSAKYILTPQCCLASFTDWHIRFSLSLKEKQQYVVKGFWEQTVQTVNQLPDLLRGNKKKEGKGHCVSGSWFFWSRLSGRRMDNVVMTSDEEMLPENDRTHFGESWKIAITC